MFDFGSEVLGGLEAGVELARICTADAAAIQLVPSQLPGTGIEVFIHTDDPLVACLGSQYAGWPLRVGDYSAMASGPMRMVRGREEMLEQLQLTTVADAVVGVLESDNLPTAAVIDDVADQCGVAPDAVTLCVAPTTSIAGSIQIVARSIETAMHKLYELEFDVRQIRSASGSAPLPPPATDMVEGIGRTNDAILYGGRVTLFVDADPRRIAEIGPRVPSAFSSDFGRPFGDIFRGYDYDFYKVDPLLFSPAEITFVNVRDGRQSRFGHVVEDVLSESFH